MKLMKVIANTVDSLKSYLHSWGKYWKYLKAEIQCLKNQNPIDQQYRDMVLHILREGELVPTSTPDKAYRVFDYRVIVDFDEIGQDTLPMLTSKFVPYKSLIAEIFWIYVLQSNVVQELRDLGSKVWNEWEGQDGTIGKAYGWQVRNYDQIANVIKQLKENPYNRRIIINLWSNEHLSEMNLPPCAFMTIWNTYGGKLNVKLIQRSTDVGLGFAFNLAQYAFLMKMVSICTGLPMGTMIHDMTDVHIYEHHVAVLKEQLTRPVHKLPTLVFDHTGLAFDGDDLPNFFDLRPENFKLEGYEHSGKLHMPVSVHTEKRGTL